MAKEARSVEADYEAKLEEAERLIRRLRCENEEQRKEVRTLISVCLVCLFKCNYHYLDNLIQLNFTWVFLIYSVII